MKLPCQHPRTTYELGSGGPIHCAECGADLEKPECPDCRGMGGRNVGDSDAMPYDFSWKPCPTCKGMGR